MAEEKKKIDDKTEKETKEKIKTQLYQQRLPDDLIENLEKLANKVGVSLNQYFLFTLMEKVEKSNISAFSEK